MVVRAILFDLDGTLVDSLEDIAVALDAALVDAGLPTPTRPLVRSWIGGGAANLVRRAVDHLGRGAGPSPDDVLARFRAHYAAVPVRHTRVFAELEPELERFAASNITLGVLTNKPHDLAVKIADALLGRWPFAVIAGQRAGIPLKPDPMPALMLAEELGVQAAQCALVGDAGTDIETAHAAGMIPVGVTWGYRPREELVAARPSLLAERAADLRVLVA